MSDLVHQARRRPLVFDMIYWDGNETTAVLIAAWVGNVGPRGASGFRLRRKKGIQVGEVFDVLHDTWVTVYKGQWVVKDLKGECYPISERTLYDSYEFICHSHSPGEDSP